jgi:DNA-binding GntR family transcriptional regulator
MAGRGSSVRGYELRRQIRAGEPEPGQRMPAETELVERFRVSLPTVRQALGVLRSEGLIEPRHGIGTFVKESRRLQRRSRHRSARASCPSRSPRTRSSKSPRSCPRRCSCASRTSPARPYAHARDQWIARLPTADEAATLELAAGSPVIHVIHTAEADDGTVLEVSESIWPAERVVILDDYPITAEAAEPDAPSEV